MLRRPAQRRLQAYQLLPDCLLGQLLRLIQALALDPGCQTAIVPGNWAANPL